MKKSLILFLSILFLIFNHTTMLTDLSSKINNEVKSIYNKNQNISNCIDKYAYDLNNNKYLIREFPNGYLIYSMNEKKILEYSDSTKSPYINYNINLIYQGVGNYFILEDNEITNLLTLKSFNLNYVKASPVYNDYVETTNISTTNSSTIIKHPEFFYDFCNDNCSGDPNRGICGYVGLALLLGYIDYYKSSDFMNDVYYAYDKGLFNNNVSFSLSYYLYCLDPKDGTTAIDIANVIKIYAEEQNLSYTDFCRLFLFFNDNTINEALENDIPVELFVNGFTYVDDKTGEIKTLGNHAVVAYSSQFIVDDLYGARNIYTVHLGWGGYGNVTIDQGLIGSIYYVNKK